MVKRAFLLLCALSCTEVFAQSVFNTTNEVLGLTEPDRTLVGNAGNIRWTVNARIGGQPVNLVGPHAFNLDVYSEDNYRVVSVTNDNTPRVAFTNGQVRFSFGLYEPGTYEAEAWITPNGVTSEAYRIAYVNFVITNAPSTSGSSGDVTVNAGVVLTNNVIVNNITSNIYMGGAEGSLTNGQTGVTLHGNFFGTINGSSGAIGIFSNGVYVGAATALTVSTSFGLSVTDGVCSIFFGSGGAVPPTAVGSNVAKFFYTGDDQYFVVPAGVSQLVIKVWGGAGSAANPAIAGVSMAVGGYTYAYGRVSPLETLTLRVPSGGVKGNITGGPTCTNYLLGGGGRHFTTSAVMASYTAGSGGGGGWVFRNSTTNIIPLMLSTDVLAYCTPLAVAGGGGAGGSLNVAAQLGGQGGGTSGQTLSGVGAGGGGTKTTGGAGGSATTNGQSGAFGEAGTSTVGGAGGGGWYGGGSGGWSSGYAGGGGGSGYVNPEWSGATYRWNATTDDDYVTGIGAGATPQSGHGMIVIRY